MGNRVPPFKFAAAGLGITTLYCRELGYHNPAMEEPYLSKTLIGNVQHKTAVNIYDVTDSIFNLEYSPNGKIVGAACAKNCFVLYDSLNHSVTACMPGAHAECCNGITFLSDNKFATFSDDKTVRMWDTRHMKQCTQILKGHNGWIKNVNKVFGENKIITSSFDNSVRIYDLNDPDKILLGKHLFCIPGLMRLKLAPLSDFLIVSVRGGSIYKLSNIKWEHLAKDYQDFEDYVNGTRVIRGEEVLLSPVDVTKLSLFHEDRNTLRFLHYGYEFENEPDCHEMATSLSIHPDEHCVIARHERLDFRRSDQDEQYTVNWSSVYDLRDRPLEDRFKLMEDKFVINENDKIMKFPNVVNLDDATHKIINHVLSRGKTENLRRRCLRHSIINPPRRAVRDIAGIAYPYPSYDDMYDSSFYVVEYPNNLGMIKENCFHPSGLYMCSPFQNGFRIFTFNEKGEDFRSAADPEMYKFESTPLHEAKTLFEHPGETLCVKCHPWNPQIVSGCFNGVLNWYETRF